MSDVEQTTTRTLRELAAREDIRCTSSLVQAYNDAIDEAELQALSTWIQRYLAVVSQSAPEEFPLEQLYEFAQLGRLRKNDARTADIICRAFSCLRRHVKPGENRTFNVVLALECFLSTVSATYLEQQATNVTSLVKDLLVLTNASQNLLNSASYVANISHLLAMEKALLTLRGIGANNQAESVDHFRRDVIVRLNLITQKQKYYPIAFQAYVIKKNIKMHRLYNLCPSLFDVGRYVFLFLGSGLHFCQGLREIMQPEFDLNSILEGIKEIRQAISDGALTKVSSYFEISMATFEAMAVDDFNNFVQCFENLGSWKIRWNTQSKSLMIKYALLIHLCFFFHGESSQTIQDHAMDLLRKLALDERYSRWRSDPVLYAGLLEVITSIAVQYSHHHTTCYVIFNQMQSSATDEQIDTITNILGTQNFVEKVRGLQMARNNERGRSLFDIVKLHAGINQSFSMCVRNKELLLKNYKDNKFAMVPLIMGLHQEKHVKDFDFNLVMYERVLLRNENISLSNQDEYNQVANNVQRTTRIKKSITIQEIFKNQDEIVGGLIEKNRVVLAIGNPGTGKTSLSKRLCYDWANGNWGSMFTHVYLLRVRQLSRISQGPHLDLVHAIVKLCYNPDHHHECRGAICEEVRDRLQDKTTLLILDGLDEGDDKAWELVHLSLEQSCNQLLLSRPHNIQRIRDKADIEIECLEFSDEHLKSFILKELPQEEVEEFSQFLNQSLSIWEAARIPVNAQIISNMWMSLAKDELKTMKIINLAWLYDQMVNYVWMRYTKKEDVDVKVGEKDSVLSSLEVIAFESFMHGKVEIPEYLVLEHSKTESEAILRDAGFLLFVQEGQVFQFAHLTFHEYFAGRHLAKMLDSNSDKEQRNAKRFICEHKYRDTSRVVFAFMIGIYCREDYVEESLECFKKLINILDDDPVEPIGLQHAFLKMRALDTFLTCCPNTDDLRSKDAQVNEIVSTVVGIVKDWLGINWVFTSSINRRCVRNHLWDKIINDLANMPNLHLEYDCFLEMILNTKDIAWTHYLGLSDQIIKIARFNLQVLRTKVPQIPNELNEQTAWRSWAYWMCIYCKVNEECAIDALSHLLEVDKRFGQRIHSLVMEPALVLLEKFPDNEDLKQIFLDLLQHSDSDVRRYAIYEISQYSFQPGSSAETFVWSIQKQAMQYSDENVRERAFDLLHRDNQILKEDIDEVIEMLTKEINNPYPGVNAGECVHSLLKATPHKKDQLLSLLKKLLLHENKIIRDEARSTAWNIYRGSLLAKDKLLSFVSSIFQDVHWHIQHDLLPILSILEIECESLSTGLVETIANGSIDVNEDVKSMTHACKEAREILSTKTMQEIQTNFKTYSNRIQVEIVEHIYQRKLFTLETADAVAKIASICIPNNNCHRKFSNGFFKNVAISLLEDIAKEFRLPANELKELAKSEYRYKSESNDHSWSNVTALYNPFGPIIRKQPLDHLLNYYFESKDNQIIPTIAEKLLSTPVSFARVSDSEMKLKVIDGGSLVEKRVYEDDVQRLIFLCKAYLKTYHNFRVPVAK